MHYSADNIVLLLLCVIRVREGGGGREGFPSLPPPPSLTRMRTRKNTAGLRDYLVPSALMGSTYMHNTCVG